VVAIELVPELKTFGETNVRKYDFVERGIAQFICGDGSKGYKSQAPFDKILASASIQSVKDEIPNPGREIPLEWKNQLKIGGRIVTPIDSSIWLFIKKSETEFEKTEYPGFVFVPFVEK
jgi:protein-L-isoaspartate(D-aspartate) O-methyltransferase